MLHRSRRLPGLLITLATIWLAALVLTGCSRITGPRQWSAAASLVGGGSYVINVRDSSGRVADVEIDPPDADPVADAVSNPPGQPNVVLVAWTGGACDEQTDVDIAGSEAALALTMSTRVKAGDCDAIGVGHVLRLTATGPLPAGSVTVIRAR